MFSEGFICFCLYIHVVPFISSIFYIIVLHNSKKFGPLSKGFILLLFLLGIYKYILGIESKILPLKFFNLLHCFDIQV